jgi:MFS transporter, DHA1 family, staphyloferrin A biosynthesis exporter
MAGYQRRNTAPIHPRKQVVNNTKHSTPGSDNRTFTTFRALRYPSYRYLWLGQLGHSATMWMEQVIRPLLILELTGSALQVGFIVSLRMLPQLIFGLLAGVIADRYNKRFILIFSQIVTMLMNLILALLLLTGHLAIWHVYVTAFISGASMAFNQPSRQSLVPRLVPPEMLLNALSLNTAAMNIMRILGASLAGLLLIFFDYGQVYLLNAVIFIGVIWTTVKIKTSENIPSKTGEKTTRIKRTLLSDFVDGFRYVSGNPVLLYLVGLGLLLFIFALPYQQVFIPLLALDVLAVGRSGAGWLLAFSGVGALIGSLVIASLRQLSRRGLLLMSLLLLLGFSLVMLAQSRWFFLSALALVVAGGVSSAYFALSNSLLLEQSPMEYHGRVMSLMSLDRGLVSIGAAVAGFLAEALGPQPGLTILAGICVVFTVLMFLAFRPLRNIS